MTFPNADFCISQMAKTNETQKEDNKNTKRPASVRKREREKMKNQCPPKTNLIRPDPYIPYISHLQLLRRRRSHSSSSRSLRPHFEIALRQGDRGLDHLHDIDPLLRGADGERDRRHDPRPANLALELREREQIHCQEEDLVGRTEREQHLLQRGVSHSFLQHKTRSGGAGADLRAAGDSNKPTYIIRVVQIQDTAPLLLDRLVAADAAVERGIHVHVVACEVETDEALEEDCPFRVCRGEEAEEARGRAAVRDHVEDGAELCRLVEGAGGVAVEGVEEA